MQSEVFHLSRSSDGKREWFSARDAATGVSIPCECKDSAIALVTSLNSAFKHHLTAALSDQERAVEVVWPDAQEVAEILAEGRGVWVSCTGCHELNEGVPTGPFNTVLKSHVGTGCFECGGIGAIWDTTDYSEMARFVGARDGRTASGEVVMGMPVAAYMEETELGVKFSTHWSSVPEYRESIRLFSEADVRSALVDVPVEPVASVPVGWALVPINPSGEMVAAGGSWSALPGQTWADMIDAAPIGPTPPHHKSTEKPVALIEREALAELQKHKTATGTVCSPQFKSKFGDKVPLYTHPPHREGEDSAEVDGLTKALMAAYEEFNRIACEFVTETRSASDALDRCQVFANRGASIIRTTLAATRSGSATTQKGCAE